MISERSDADGLQRATREAPPSIDTPCKGCEFIIIILFLVWERWHRPAAPAAALSRPILMSSAA